MLDRRAGEPRAERAVGGAPFVTDGKIVSVGLVLGGIDQAAIDRRNEPGGWISGHTTGEGRVIYNRLNIGRHNIIRLDDAVILQIHPQPVEDPLVGFPYRAEIPGSSSLRLQIRIAGADYSDVV